MLKKANTIEDVIAFLNNLQLRHHLISENGVLDDRYFHKYIRMLIAFNGVIKLGNYVFTRIYSEHKFAYVMGFCVDDEVICYDAVFKYGDNIIETLQKLEVKLKIKFANQLENFKSE